MYGVKKIKKVGSRATWANIFLRRTKLLIQKHILLPRKTEIKN